jgi:hypothetical protein
MDSSFQIYIDSVNATRYFDSTNYCEYKLPLIEVDSQYHFNISVIDANIPYSFYNVNNNNNTLSYVEDPYYSFIVHNITIPVGNYTINSLVTTLNSLIQPLTVTYNNLTNKMTFVHPTLQFGFYTDNNTCFELLGFNKINHFSGTSPRTLISDTCCNLNSIRSICICTNYHTNNIHVNKPTMRSMIASIPVNAQPNQLISYQNMTAFRNNLYTNVLHSIVIKLIDQNGDIVNLNGAHYSMTLQIDLIKFVID